METDVKRSIRSSEMQTADWRRMLHVTYSGMLTSPVRRSEKTRLHSNRFVIVLRCFFLATKTSTSPLANIISNPSVIGGMSSFALNPSGKDSRVVLFGSNWESVVITLLVALYGAPFDIFYCFAHVHGIS